MTNNQFGFAHILVLLIIIVGIVAGILIIRNPVIFTPRANNGPTTTDASQVQITPSGWDYNLTKRCVRSVGFLGSANYYQDLSECNRGEKSWTVAVQAESKADTSCLGPNAQSLPIDNRALSLNWFPHTDEQGRQNKVLHMKIDYLNHPHPCGAGNFTWLTLMDNIGNRGGPLPRPDQARTSMKVSFSDNRANGEDRFIVGYQAFMNITRDDHQPAISLEVSFVSPGWGASQDPGRYLIKSKNNNGNYEVSLDGNALARDRKFGITTNPRNGEGDLTINWYEIFEYLIANQIIPNVRGGTFTDQNSKGTVMFVAIEANNHTRTQSILSEFWITNYRNESVIRPALVPSGSITATQNPCTIPTGQVLCTAKISFTSTNTKDAYVKVRQTGGIVTRGESGSFDAPWISTTPLNLDLYEGTKLLSSVEVKGTPQQVVVTKPTGSITASPNPCAIPSGQLLCASVITWTSSNTKDTVHVRIRETGAVFTRGASGTATAPWITGTPLHFDLYDGTELLGTAKVTGEVSKARFITANPNPCTLKADGLCSTSLSVNAPGYTNLQIKVREINTPLTGVAQTLPGPMVAPWIPAQGYTFDLYSNGTLIDSLQVKGIR